jgi:hypothetical protein
MIHLYQNKGKEGRRATGIREGKERKGKEKGKGRLR